MSNASWPVYYIVIYIYIIYAGPLSCILGCKIVLLWATKKKVVW